MSDWRRGVDSVALLACVALILGSFFQVGAQTSAGHRFVGETVVVDRPEQWRNWTGPSHVVDVLPDGTVKPHRFRQVYDIIEEDRGIYGKPVDAPSIRRDDRAIMNLERVFQREEDGTIEVAEKTERLLSFLDEDFRRFPGNDSHIQVGGQFYAIVDTSRDVAEKEVTLALRSLETDATTRQTFAETDKVSFPVYRYLQRVGVSRVGSNESMARNVVDGDRTTYWEPDLDADPDRWWIEVDLGRVVVVERVVLHFVDEEQGDPFRQFRVMLAPQQKLIQSQSRVLSFRVVGQTQAPNTDQRTMSFSSEDTPGFAEDDEGRTDWTGRMAQTMRILVGDSKLRRARQIMEAEWRALDAEDRGDILYYIRDEAGFEEPVDGQIYEELPAEQQGRKEYHIRERPRLAGVEVWGWGDNLSPDVISGGGSVDFTGPEVPAGGFDADWDTSFRMPAWFESNPQAGILTVDIGARVWLDAMRLAVRTMPGYIVEGADGSRDASGRLRWRRVSPPDRAMAEGGFSRAADNLDPPMQVRSLRLRLPGVERTSGFFYNLTEVLLYTEGFVAEAAMTSDIIRLPGPRNFGAIRWEPGPQAAPEGTEVQVRTRTGDLLVQQIRYFDKNGNRKTKDEWDKLITSWKGPVDTTFGLGSGWSPWSQKYLHSGDQVTSPGLRNFMQIQTRFISRDRNQAAKIQSIEVDLVPPVARALVGEVWPMEALAGRLDTFQVFLRPTFIDGPATFRTPGFDEILLEAPAGVTMDLVDLSMGTEEEFFGGDPFQTFLPTTEGSLVDAEGNLAEVLRNGDDSLWVRLPQPHGSLSRTLAERVYNRITPQGSEVVVGEDGDFLTEAAYNLLPEEDRGAIRYFQKDVDGTGALSLSEVADRSSWEDLPQEERGPIRYFRKLRGGGAQSPFDARGDSLSRTAYNALPGEEQGMILADGRLIRLRFTASLFLNGTTFKAFARRGSGEASLRQQAEAGDATGITAARNLTVQLPLEGGLLDDLSLSPNPFSPNGDGINDIMEVAFSVFHVSEARPARVRIYRLDGGLVWEAATMGLGGPHEIPWDGRDAQGRVVPPGLYICQIHLGADAKKAKGTTLSRLVTVVY